MKEVLKTQGEGVDIKSRAVSQAAIDHFRYTHELLQAHPLTADCLATHTQPRVDYETPGYLDRFSSHLHPTGHLIQSPLSRV